MMCPSAWAGLTCVKHAGHDGLHADRHDVGRLMWCDDPMLTEDKLRAELAALRAEVGRLRKHLGDVTEALIWCSGSSDFSREGQAGEGWSTFALPRLRDALDALAPEPK